MTKEHCKKHVEWNVEESMFLMWKISPKWKMKNEKGIFYHNIPILKNKIAKFQECFFATFELCV